MIEQNKDKRKETTWWEAYGGWSAIFKSRYFAFAFPLALVSFPFQNWMALHEPIMSVIPSLVGFSLGGYAILMAFGNTAFQRILANAGKDDPKRPQGPVYLEVSATFVHFILLQFTSLGMALAWNGIQNFLELFGYSSSSMFLKIVASLVWFCFIYALLAGIAATLWIFKLSSWFCSMHHREEQNQLDDEKKKEENTS